MISYVDIFNKIIIKIQSSYKSIASNNQRTNVIGLGADGEPTTLIDKFLETSIIEELEKMFTSGTILSEEVGMHLINNTKGDFTFVIDPLDGTSNVLMGFPYYAMSFAILRENICCSSLVYNYCTMDMFYAVKGEGAYLNGESIFVTKESDLKLSRILLSRPFNKNDGEKYLHCLLNINKARITGCASLDIASVAMGGFMAYVDYHTPEGLLKTHDIIAAKLILEEAGGFCLNENGQVHTLDLNVTSKYMTFSVNSMKTFDALIKFFI